MTDQFLQGVHMGNDSFVGILVPDVRQSDIHICVLIPDYWRRGS